MKGYCLQSTLRFWTKPSLSKTNTQDSYLHWRLNLTECSMDCDNCTGFGIWQHSWLPLFSLKSRVCSNNGDVEEKYICGILEHFRSDLYEGFCSASVWPNSSYFSILISSDYKALLPRLIGLKFITLHTFHPFTFQSCSARIPISPPDQWVLLLRQLGVMSTLISFTAPTPTFLLANLVHKHW